MPSVHRFGIRSITEWDSGRPQAKAPNPRPTWPTAFTMPWYRAISIRSKSGVPTPKPVQGSASPAGRSGPRGAGTGVTRHARSGRPERRPRTACKDDRVAERAQLVAVAKSQNAGGGHQIRDRMQDDEESEDPQGPPLRHDATTQRRDRERPKARKREMSGGDPRPTVPQIREGWTPPRKTPSQTRLPTMKTHAAARAISSGRTLGPCQGPS